MNRNQQFKNPKFYAMIAMDIVCFALAIHLSYLLRFEFSLANMVVVHPFKLLPWVIPLKFFVFYWSGLYKGMWRYTSLRDFWLLVQACLFSTGLVMSIILVANRFVGYSRAVFIIDCFLTLFFTGGIRLGIRTFYAIRTNQMATAYFSPDAAEVKVLIVGAGDAGEKLLREIRDNYRLNYDVAGFIDDDLAKQGMTIHGVRVLGTVEQLPRVLRRRSITQILIAIPSATSDQIRRIVEICRHCNVPHQILPSIGEIIDGRVSVKMLRDIRYEDLLPRSPVEMNTDNIHNYIDGKIVLVTGCGGSIGSELCRQIVKFQPGRLVLLDSSEFNLFNLQMELQNEIGFYRFDAVLGQVQDEILMEDVFARYKPAVIFHAAAYKHVPMLEKNPWQAVFNNIIGSLVAMEMAVKYHADRFVLVSTDKAVRPTNVMGASKRVTELIMQCQQGNGTRFMAVRFGNVVGSSGSVIPLFRHQIEKGGPVTVTHPEINRFFMTIPEAAQMILQAGTMGKGNEIFILRMGTPVKIADMARDLIRLSGKEPDVDIKIVYTGLREGEKLYEELITEGEDILPTDNKEVMVLRSDNLFNGTKNYQEAKKALYGKIEELKELCRIHDAQGIKLKLGEIVTEYTPQHHESVFDAKQ